MPNFRSFFETPKKARITVICMVAALATLGAVIAYIVWAVGAYGGDVPPAQTASASDAPSQSVPPDESAGPSQPAADAPPVVGLVPSLTIDQARELALAHAGVPESGAEFSREALADDNGIMVYEFRFSTGDARYEYMINANTGEVRGMVKEALVTPGPETAQPVLPTLPAGSESVPPVETAPQPSAAPPTSTAPSQAQPSAMYIGMDRAKSIALEHAGFTADQVRFTHTRMDRENGAVVYEIEFRQGRTEYEYEIDAATGRVLDVDRDAH